MVNTPNYDLDIDSTLGGDNASDYVIPSQKAIKSYVDNNTGSTVDQVFDPTSQAAQSGVAIAGANFLTSSDLADYVTTNTAQDITGVKTFVGQKMIAFKQASSSNKLGFTLYNNNNVEKGYLEFNPTNTIDGAPLMTLGNYASSAAAITHIGFRKYSSVSGASGAYNLLAPLISDAKTPFNLTTTYTNFYLPLGFTDGNTIVTTAKSGLVNLSSLIPTVPTVDQTYDGTSTNPQSGVAIAGAGFLTSIPSTYLQNTATGTKALTILGTATSYLSSINIGYNSDASGGSSTALGSDATASESYSTALGSDATASGACSTALGYGTTASISRSTALGYGATASHISAIQLGYGTNSTANTLSVGFFNNTSTHYNWQLLEGTTGLIPDARISSNIARTADIPSAVTESTVSGWGFTKNVGTVTSVNNETPDSSGNISLNIPIVDQTYDSTSTNAQSGVAIAGAGFLTSIPSSYLQNVATDTNALSILSNNSNGTATTLIGADTVCSTAAQYGTAIGYHAQLGPGSSAIQLGYGTNSTANSFNVGFYNNSTTHYNWQLLNGTTGLIPDERISSNIARTSQIPDISTKQDTLVSGTNIKTVNGTSILGSGNIDTSEIFVAEYGTTPYLIVSQAKSSNKTVFCKYNNIICTYFQQLSNAHTFVYCNGNSQLAKITIDNSNAWSIEYTNLANTSLSNLSTTGQAIIDGKADTTLSNVSSIDSNSAVQTALNGKVNKSGDTMTGGLVIQRDDNSLFLRCQRTDAIKGTTPSSSIYWGLHFIDGQGSNVANRMGGVELRYTDTGGVRTDLLAYEPISGSTTNERISIGYSSTGGFWTYAPKPIASSDTINIATTNWVHDNISYRANNTVTGEQNVSAFLTSSKTRVYFTIHLPKKLNKISDITVTKMLIHLRVPTGGYLASDGWNALSNSTITVSDEGQSINVVLYSSSAFSSYNNNIPLCGMVEFGFRFT